MFCGFQDQEAKRGWGVAAVGRELDPQVSQLYRTQTCHHGQGDLSGRISGQTQIIGHKVIGRSLVRTHFNMF